MIQLVFRKTASFAYLSSNRIVDAAFAQLRQLANAIEPLNESDWEDFSGLFTPYKARRKEQLTQTGEVERHLYFVVEGVQRVYHVDEQSREATIVFTYPPSFGGVLDSMMLQTPSRYYYETLTASTFLRANFAACLELKNKCKPVEILLHKGMTLAFSGVLERLAELQSYSSEEKFKNLLRRSPHILQLVPHKYLANYLGIDPTNFSKLINQVRI